MTYTPEKIFATGSSTTGSWNFEPLPTRLSPAQTEYTRTDVADARIKELEAALIGVLPYVSTSREDAECASMERFDRPIGNAVSIARAALKGDANED